MKGKRTVGTKGNTSALMHISNNFSKIKTWRFWVVQGGIMSVWMIFYFLVLTRYYFIGGPIDWVMGFYSVTLIVVVNIIVNVIFSKFKNWFIYWINLLWVSILTFCLAGSPVDYSLIREFTSAWDEFMQVPPELGYFATVSRCFIYELIKALIFSFISSLAYGFLYDRSSGNFKLNETAIKSQTAIALVSMLIIIFSVAYTLQELANIWEVHKEEDKYMTSSMSSSASSSMRKVSNFPRPRHGEDYSIYIDFSQSSAKNRFVVVDNKNREVIATSKCAHGAGKGSTIDTPVFSNEVGSKCTSLGEYRVAEVSKMNNTGFECLRLDGLSKTNSNARKRGIVIHELPILTDHAFDGAKIPLSEFISSGCFSISPEVFSLLKELRTEGKTMYIYATCE